MASSDQDGPGEFNPVSAQSFVHALTPILTAVTEQIDGPIQQAAELVATSLRANGVIQAFGSGHSEALAMEIAGRAGAVPSWSATRRTRASSTSCRPLARATCSSSPRTPASTVRSSSWPVWSRNTATR
jgi:hypothetical protein